MRTQCEYVYGMLLEDPCNNNIRETVCRILMEALSSRFDFDGAEGASLCDSLFVLLDFDKQQQQQ